MGIFDSLSSIRKTGKKVMGTVDAIADTAHSTRSAFGGISDNERVPYSNLMGNPSGARGRDSLFRGFDPNDDDDDDGIHYASSPVIVTEEIREVFRKKAKLKVDIISGRIKSDGILKKIGAKLLIQNTGDEDIANKYRDYTPDQIKELPKPTQKIIRNQKHVKAIDAIDLTKELKEQCVEYFAIEFEDEYLANDGRMPDFSQFNPMELMFQNFNAPYKELMGDLVLDLGMELKPKAIEFLTSLYQKVVKKKIEELQQEQTSEQLPEVAIPIQEQPSVEVVENQEHLAEIIALPITQKRWASSFKQDGKMPDLDIPNYEEFLASKGMDIDDLAWGNDNEIFPNVEARIGFLNEFDKFNSARLNSTHQSIEDKLANIHADLSPGTDEGQGDIDEHIEDIEE